MHLEIRKAVNGMTTYLSILINLLINKNKNVRHFLLYSSYTFFLILKLNEPDGPDGILILPPLCLFLESSFNIIAINISFSSFPSFSNPKILSNNQ